MTLLDHPRDQEAENAAPHRFTWEEVLRLAEIDAFGPTTRIELIGGELFLMPEEGYAHVDAVFAVQQWLLSALAPRGLLVRIREPVHLPDGSVTIPDLSVFPAGTRARDMQAPRAELLIEVADTTERRDRRIKLPLYAAAGVNEVWLVQAAARVVGVHRRPIDGAFSFVDRFLPGQPVAPLCAPDAAFDPATLPEPEPG